MSGLARWITAAVASIATFAMVVIIMRSADWSWLPKDDGDKWSWAAGSGAVAAAAVLAGLGWWASQASGPNTGRVAQRAVARDEAEISQRAAGSPPGGRAGRVRQKAKGSGKSRIRQSG